jgi:hypothetical protein
MPIYRQVREASNEDTGLERQTCKVDRRGD